MSAEDREDELERMRDHMDETRAHLSGTADALGHALSEKKDAVRERLDVGDLVQRHPWPAVGVAVALGLALAATGADRAAATATKEGARRASRSAGDAVRRRRERAHAEQEPPREEHESRGGLVGRLTRSILHAIDVDALVAQIRDAGAHLTHARQPQEVSRNRLAGTDYWK